MKNFAQNNGLFKGNTEDKKEKLNIGLFLSGKIVSLLGTYTYSFAISLYILKVTGSGTSFALSVLMSMVPRIILGPFAGALADRLDRKKMVVGLDILSGIVVLSLLGVSSIYGLKIVFIYATTFILSVISTFFDVTITASLPNLVSDKSLMKINSYTQAASSLASISGPVAGGLVYGLVPMNLFLLINGLSFILSACSESFINFNFNKKDADASITKAEKISMKAMIQDIREVFYFIKDQSTLFSLLKFALIFNVLINSTLAVVFPYIINNVLKMSSAQYGFLEAAFSVGVLITAIVIGKLPEKEKKLKGFFIGTLMMGIMIVAMGIPTINYFNSININILFLYFIAVLIIFAIALVMVETPLHVSVQRLAPDKIRGRVWGVLGTISGGIAPIGIVLAGIFVDTTPPFIIPIVSGLIISALAIITLKSKSMQSY